MTETLISLISIFTGIIGANSASYIFEKYSFGLIGNTIAGVFGSILIIKAFGKLGFDPQSIMELGTVDYFLLILNFIISFFGGSFGIVLISKLKNKINKIQALKKL